MTRILLAVVGCAIASVAFGQSQTGNGKAGQDVVGLGGWGSNSAYNLAYNPNSEVTLTGKVTGVVETESPATRQMSAATNGAYAFKTAPCATSRAGEARPGP